MPALAFNGHVIASDFTHKGEQRSLSPRCSCKKPLQAMLTTLLETFFPKGQIGTAGVLMGFLSISGVFSGMMWMWEWFIGRFTVSVTINRTYDALLLSCLLAVINLFDLRNPFVRLSWLTSSASLYVALFALFHFYVLACDSCFLNC